MSVRGKPLATIAEIVAGFKMFGSTGRTLNSGASRQFTDQQLANALAGALVYGDVHVQHPAFGAVADGVADDTAAIQAAFDYVLEGGKRGKVVLGARHRTTKTLHAGYGHALRSIAIEGAGGISAYAAEPYFSGTTIICDFWEGPVINIQGARGSSIRGVAFVGKNRSHAQSNQMGGDTPLLDDLVINNWYDPAMPAASKDRYSPYCAIAIDGYSGAQPTPAYPAVTYPPALGISTQYNKIASSNVTIENCWFGGFVVGVANQPSNHDANADFTTVKNCAFEYMPYAISVCNTQSRNFAIDSCKFAFIHTCVTNRTHGVQLGRLNGTIQNNSIGQCIQFFDLTESSRFGPIEIKG
ncbi:MAG: hypothetical protein ACRDAM_22520, partial [Casimicrobium sp.]